MLASELAILLTCGQMTIRASPRGSRSTPLTVIGPTAAVGLQRLEVIARAPRVGEARGIGEVDLIPTYLHPGTAEAAAGQQAGRGRGLLAFHVEVDPDGVTQRAGRARVEVAPPRLEPV